MSPSPLALDVAECHRLAGDPAALISYLSALRAAGVDFPDNGLPVWLHSILICDAFAALGVPARAPH